MQDITSVIRFTFQAFESPVFKAQIVPAEEMHENVVRLPIEEETPLPSPTFSMEELEARELSGYARGEHEGYAKGLVEGKTAQFDLQARLEIALEPLFIKMAEALHSYAAREQDFKTQTVALALALAQKVSGKALVENPTAKFEETLAEVAPLFFQEPEITVTVAPEYVEILTKKIDTLAAKNSYSGRIHVLGNEALNAADIEIGWNQGGIVFNEKNVWSEIEMILSKV